MPSAEYLDCRLELRDVRRARLVVKDRRYDGMPTLDEETNSRLLRAKTNPKVYGSILFDAVLPKTDELRRGFRDALNKAEDLDARLRLQLDIPSNAPELHQYQWEYLYDSERDSALACSPSTAFSRYLNVPATPPTEITGKPRLLVVLSNPNNLRDYGLARENPSELRRSVESSLSPLRGFLSFEFLDGPATPERIHQRLSTSEFHGLHLHSHGRLRPGRSAGLALEKEDKTVDFVTEDRFSQVVEGHRDLRLVVLIACHSGDRSDYSNPFSGLGPRLVKHNIPAVLVMQHRVGISAAKLFTKHFYSNLALPKAIDAAANEARKQLFLNKTVGVWEWGSPALYLRLSDGLPWRIASGAASLFVEIDDSKIEWEGVLNSLEDDDLLPILGPGLYGDLLPSADDIAALWATKYRYPLTGQKTLPRVSQYVHTNIGKQIPHRSLHKLITKHAYDQLDPGSREQVSNLDSEDVLSRLLASRKYDPHRILAELPVSTYLTTNYDGLMAAALRLQGKKPFRRACVWKRDLQSLKSIGEYDDLEGSQENPLVFHLYGSDHDPASQVLTQDEHLDFLGEIVRTRDRIPSFLRGRLSEALLLFLGYKVTDLGCRILFRGLIARLKEQGRDRLAVLQVDDYKNDSEGKAKIEKFVSKYCSGLSIQVYSGSVAGFLLELRRRWKDENEFPGR